MAEHAAVPIDTIQGHMLSADGTRLLLKTEQPVALAVHTSALFDLLSATVAGIGEAKAKSNPTDNGKLTFGVDWWEIGLERDQAGAVFTFRLHNGAELCFRIPMEQIPHMRDVLSTISGTPPQSPEQRSVQ